MTTYDNAVFHPQQSNTNNRAECVCSSVPLDTRPLEEGYSYHIYEAKEFTHDCQEAAVTNTFKQELKAETLLYLPTFTEHDCCL